MKKSNHFGCMWIVITTVLIFFGSLYILSPIISNIGYTSVESSYHLLTHALLVALILTLITCTKLIMDKLNEILDTKKDA